MAWAQQGRDLPPDWPVRVSAAKARAHGLCEALEHEPGCDDQGAECDHIDGRDNHDLTNLQWLSHACHAAKTQREAQQGLDAIRIKLTHPSARRQHPGLIDGGPDPSPTPET